MKLQIIVVLLISFLVCSCKDDSNPALPLGSSITYIGGIGSHRTYLTTESWFAPFTDTPFVAVPDSLLSRITLSDSLRKLGVVGLSHQDETVKELSTFDYNLLNLPLPHAAYKMSQGPGSDYNLYDEVQRLAYGESYENNTYEFFALWHEDTAQVQNVYPPNEYGTFPPLPWLKKPLYIGETWIRYQVIDTLTGRLVRQTSAKVLGLDEVSTKAGTFQAFKLELFSLGDHPSDLFNEFEYYVPDVGLVLYQLDREVSSPINLPHGGGHTTLNYRQVIRKELTSFKVFR